MENLIEYLDESLIPLEEKVKEYLHIERDIRLLEVELLSLQSIKSDFNPETHTLENSMSSSSLNDKEQKMSDMMEKYRKLQQEVIAMLPENKFVELNLGYGPSQVGYFTVDPETHVTLDEPLLRVVH